MSGDSERSTAKPCLYWSAMVGLVGLFDELESRIASHAADDDDLVGLTVLLDGQGPRRAARRVPRRAERHEGRAAQRDLVAVLEHPVDRVRLVAGPHALEKRHVLGHRHDEPAGQLLDEGVALHVIPVRVAAEDDLDVLEVEAQVLHRLAEVRDRILPVGVDQDVPLGRRDQKRREALGADVVEVSSDSVGRKLCSLLLPGADVTSEDRFLTLEYRLRPHTVAREHGDQNPEHDSS